MVYAVKTRKTLQNNSNILLSSLAVADLLVGFISFPLSIALDAFLLQRKIGLFLCRIALANQMVLYISACCFFVPFDCDCMGKVCGDKKMEGL